MKTPTHFIKLFLIFLVCCLNSYAQQEPQFTQYFTNQLTFNPATAGAEQNTHIASSFRSQWTGFEGAPLSSSLTGDHYFKKIKSGIGFISLADTIGFFKTLNFRLAYAYRINIKKTFLQVAVDGGVKIIQLDNPVFISIDPNDPSLPPSGKTTEAAPVFSAGLFFWSKRFSVGLSGQNLNGPTVFKNDFDSGYTLARHYYLYLQYRQPLGENFSLRPTFLVKTDAVSTQLDANLLGYYQQRAFIGAAYRIDDAVAVMAGVRIWKLWLQYSYDFTTSKLKGYSEGSHEAMLRYVIPFDED